MRTKINYAALGIGMTVLLALSVQRIVRWLLNARTERLWHPDSPGTRVTVTRTRFGRWFKSKYFATLTETIRANNAVETKIFNITQKTAERKEVHNETSQI
jgi:protoporphyrinogen oxidase